MMPELPYHVVDVFAARPLEGNPLTVFPDAAGLDDETMQAIALETNHSETTFITGRADDGTPRVRIFTPQTELPFAGHPTLGTAFVDAAAALDLTVGRIPIDRDAATGHLWMTQNQATFEPLSTAMVSHCLGIDVEQAVIGSTGTPVALIEVDGSDTVRAARLDVAKWAGPDVAVAYVFAAADGPGGADHDIHARSLASFVGITEDPATGGAAGPAAAWLADQGRLDGERTIHQGIEMKRPSRLHVRGTSGAIQVGGQVQSVAKGTFTI